MEAWAFQAHDQIALIIYDSSRSATKAKARSITGRHYRRAKALRFHVTANVSRAARPHSAAQGGVASRLCPRIFLLPRNVLGARLRPVPHGAEPRAHTVCGNTPSPCTPADSLVGFKPYLNHNDNFLHITGGGTTLSLGYNCLYLSVDAFTRDTRPPPVHLQTDLGKVAHKGDRNKL